MAFRWTLQDVEFISDPFIHPNDFFADYYMCDRVYQSNVFYMGNNNQISWNFRFKAKKYATLLYPVLIRAEKPVITANYKFTLINDGKEVFAKTGQDSFSLETDEWVFKNPEGFPTFISTKKLLSLYKSSLQYRDAKIRIPSFTVLCEITVGDSDVLRSTSVTIPESTWAKDLKNLFMKKDFSDVIFCAKGQEFYAHRNILAQRSPVFETLFQIEMKEKKENKVFIDDVEPEVFQALLNYIYTDDVDVEGSLASALLYAAEKYNLMRLKSVCEKKLAESLSVESAVEILIAADTLNASQLKEAVMKFIREFFMEISNTQQWLQLLRTKTNLANECLQIIFASTKQQQ